MTTPESPTTNTTDPMTVHDGFYDPTDIINVAKKFAEANRQAIAKYMESQEVPL